MKVSFDFDDTLSRESIQQFARELIDSGIDVWIVTSRYKDKDNRDLFEVADLIGIGRDNIIFTEWCNKYHFVDGFVFHLDDDHEELDLINKNTSTLGISCWGSDRWE